MYSPEAPFSLLYPQHWSQIAKDDLPQTKGIWCATYADSVVLEWQQRKYRRNVPLDPGTNVATLRSSPGYNRFKAFVSELNNTHEELITCDSRFVSDGEASDKETITNERSLLWPDYVGQPPDRSSLDPASSQDPRAVPTRNKQLPLTSYFNIHGNDNDREPVVAQDEENRLPIPESLPLHWHHKLGHLSFYKLRIMASKGDIPRELSRCCVPLCSTCLFGKATKRAWRIKGPIKHIHGQKVTKPGDCVSVDQLQYPILGLVGHMKGWLN